MPSTTRSAVSPPRRAAFASRDAALPSPIPDPTSSLRRVVVFALATGVAISVALGAQAAPGGPELTVAGIMAEDWIGTFPADPYWADDGRSIYYSKRRPQSELVDLHRIDLASGRDVVVAPSELAAADFPGVWSGDRRVKAWVRDGDLWVRESGRRAPRQLLRTTETESEPLPLVDGRVAFRRGDAYFAVDLATGRVDSLADLRFADDPEAPKPPKGFLEEQHRRLLATLATKAERKAAARALDAELRRGDPMRAPRPYYFGPKLELEAASLSPSGRHLFAVVRPVSDEKRVYDDDLGGKVSILPRFVTDSGYVETTPVREKVGTGEAKTPRLWLLDLVAGTKREVGLDALPGLAEDPLADLRAAARAATTPETSAAADAAKATTTGPRPLRFAGAAWSDDGAALAVQLLSHDHKDRWLATVPLEATAGETPIAVAPLHRESDPAWIGERFARFGWTREDRPRTVWYLSEASGFAHLYLRTPSASGGAPGGALALTAGPFEVDDPMLARDGRSFVVAANREQAGTWELYRVPVRGGAGGASGASGAMERLTTGGGITQGVLSPDEKQILLTSSWTTKPPELFVQPARGGAVAKPLTHSTTPAFDAVSWVTPEIVQVPSRHFAGTIQARVYDLPSARSTTSGASAPAVLFVHGAGYLQNAHAGWSSYFREFLFHTLLARRGFVVLDMDYRASSGYGRDHRTAIYRQMGTPEVEDLADGVEWLRAKRGVDPARVGVYGGSYGGFLTFMAMFKEPRLFAAGAALRPVTDWAHYNHGYTSPILNTPDVDPEAYRRSSPIEFAEGLAKPLLICHGMVDDNVNFQDTVLLVQRLIELGKTDLFETAIYPVEPHAFKEAASWTDEYTRILKLFETNLR